MMANANNNKPARVVSSLSVAFKKALTITEDVEQAKKEHRMGLKTLIDRYYEDVQKGKAEGIRTAKELVELVKLDLLLMGEATERTGTDSPIDEVRFQRIQESIDPDDPAIQSILDSMFKAMNGTNDEADNRPTVRMQPVDVPNEDITEVNREDEANEDIQPK